MTEVKKPRAVNRVVGLTKLGKELKKIRVDFEISRAQMAKELDITDKELGLIEIGKSLVTDAFLFRVADKYAIGADGANREPVQKLQTILEDANIESIASITFDLTQLPSQLKEVVFKLKRRVDNELAIITKANEEAAAIEKERLAQERQAKRAGKKKLGDVNLCSEVILSDSKECVLPPPEEPEEKASVAVGVHELQQLQPTDADFDELVLGERKEKAPSDDDIDLDNLSKLLESGDLFLAA